MYITTNYTTTNVYNYELQTLLIFRMFYLRFEFSSATVHIKKVGNNANSYFN